MRSCTPMSTRTQSKQDSIVELNGMLASGQGALIYYSQQKKSSFKRVLQSYNTRKRFSKVRNIPKKWIRFSDFRNKNDLYGSLALFQR